MADITLRNVVKRYDHIETIHGVDLDLKHGEFVVFVGPSGCGKSTLLRLISGLEDISSGELLFDGQLVNDVPPADRGVAKVFQSYALYPHMTVEENMSFGLRMAKADPTYIKERVATAAKILQLEPLLQRKPKDMSGGQRQRVAIGRAIVRDPEVFLFDEPLSNLDAELRVEMRVQIAQLHQQLDATMIYVTHDQVEAMTMADKIVILRDGHIEQVGAPLDLYHNPCNTFVAGFIGSPKMNFIQSEIVAHDATHTQVILPDQQLISFAGVSGEVSVGDKVTLGIRPEHLSEGGGDIEIALTVDIAEHLGGTSYLYGTFAGQKGFTVEVSGSNRAKVNDQVALNFSVENCHLFNSDGLSLKGRGDLVRTLEAQRYLWRSSTL